MTLDPLARAAWRGFVDSFRPPAGYALSGAVGTTFSLSLDALVAALLGMLDYDEDSIEDDPIGAVLAATRLGERLRVFVDAGNVAASTKQVPVRLATLLERILLPVGLEDRVFHPKVWVLHFVSCNHGAAQPDFVRVLVGSRNLASSSALELGMMLEGWVTTGYRSSFGHDVAELLQECAAMSEDRPGSMMEQVLGALHETAFDVSTLGATKTQFLWQTSRGPTLISRVPKKFERALIVSPFLGDGFLSALLERSTELRVVSTVTAFRKLPLKLLGRLVERGEAQKGDALFVMHEPDLQEDSWPFEGLHAKLLLLDDGEKQSPISFVGSANATAAGWGVGAVGNIEAMVCLKPGISMNAFVGDFLMDAKKSTRGWVRVFNVEDAKPLSEVETEQERLLWELRDLTGLPWQLNYDRADQRLELTCRGDALHKHLSALPEGAEIEVMPLGASEIDLKPTAVRGNTSWPLTFNPMPLSTVTRFVLIQARLASGYTVTRVALANLVLPHALREERDASARDELLANTDPSRIFAALVSGRIAPSGSSNQQGGPPRTPGDRRASIQAAGLPLEQLLRAFVVNPSLIREIRQLLSGRLDEPLEALIQNLEAADAGVPREVK